MSKARIFGVVFSALLVTMSSTWAQTGTNLMAKAQVGDWAQFLLNSQNETVPMMSVRDQQHWRVILFVSKDSVGLQEYFTMAGKRMGPLGDRVDLSKPYEPVPGLGAEAKIDVVSSSPDNLTVNGKAYACTKIVRKVAQAADIMKGQTGWNGTSTIWVCPDIPVGGIVRIENLYESRMTPDVDPQKISETWVLTDFGFKNWKK